MKKALGGAAVFALAIAGLVAPASPAMASTPSVSATPSAVMPYVTSSNSVVRQIVQCGNTMYAVGDFSSIGGPGVKSFSRHDAFSFNATTGAISTWNPAPNGEVDSIALSSNCATAYLGGSFSTIGGKSASRLASVSATTGALNTGFKPAPNSSVNTLVLVGSRLFVGGNFSTIAGTSRGALATVNATTGAIDNYLNLNISGTLPGNGRKAYNSQLSHNGTKLLVEGSFLTVAGQTRRQAFVVDLGTSSATLDAWYSPDFTKTCSSDESLYEKAGTWSPDDASIYVASTGGHGTGPLCDSVAKFSSAANSNLMPVWVNKTGCDSLYAVAADDTNVYVGGHQRWLNNPKGCDSAGAGAVTRSGVGAVSVSSGSATSWNPSRARGHGADDALLTSAGLWIASDTFFSSTNCAGKYHPGICFFPKG